MATTDRSTIPPGVSIVIPAHNEANVLGRTLDTLLSGASGAHDVVVVANGCTDSTAEIAEAYPGVRTIVLTEPSKHAALIRGLEAAVHHVVVLVDADIQVPPATVSALVAPLTAGTALATAPQRSIERSSASTFVRWYYDVWEQLPQSAPHCSVEASSRCHRRGSGESPRCRR